MSEEFDTTTDTDLVSAETQDASASGSRAKVSANVQRGTTIGRYVVLGKLGAGAMGVVLAAYDPELDRKVALKLLATGQRGTSIARARLQREAQALAKLDHRNVVAVYDVGVHDEQLFVAMEFVEGETLGAWMRAASRPHPWPEVVRMFTQAGRGLAAAHGAELIHRDFKPDNVMLGRDGRVRVMDFGLVRGLQDGNDPVARPPDLPTPALLTTLTQRGALLGTPAYMAAEQFEGVPADAHSDQFGFCAALYEALYGQRPFTGETLPNLIHAVQSERIEAAPRDANVPAWLRKVVVRGLAKSPSQRWPSMQALLDALADDPAVRRRKWWAAVGVVGLLGVGAWAVVTAVQRDSQTCRGMNDKLAGTWDATRRREVEAALLGTSLGHAPDTWTRVAKQLDDYTEAWVAARVDACEASDRGEQSGELLDRRMACLDAHLRSLGATVDELAQADATVLGKAVQMISSLPRVERCADVDALMAEIPPPDDPTARERVAALDEQLVVARAKYAAGRYEQATTLVDAIVREAALLGYTPLQVRAWLLQATLQAATGDNVSAEATFQLAYDGALASKMTDEAAEASSWLVYVVGYSLARPPDARHWAIDADPLARAVGSNEARSSYLQSLSAVAEIEGKLDEAQAHQEAALALLEQLHGPEHLALASVLNNLGLVADLRADPKAARAYYERALGIRERHQGPEHPLVAAVLSNLGTIAFGEDKLDEARALFERALAIQEASLGAEHPQVGNTLLGMGGLAQVDGRFDEARRLYERALTILQHSHGPEHPAVVNTIANLGSLAFDQGKFDDAIPHLERAVELRTTDASNPQMLAQLRFMLARALWSAGRDHERARELAQLARSSFAELGDASAEELREVDTWLAQASLQP